MGDERPSWRELQLFHFERMIFFLFAHLTTPSIGVLSDYH